LSAAYVIKEGEIDRVGSHEETDYKVTAAIYSVSI